MVRSRAGQANASMLAIKLSGQEQRRCSAKEHRKLKTS